MATQQPRELLTSIDAFCGEHLPQDHLNLVAELNVLERVHNVVNLVMTFLKDSGIKITNENVDQVIEIVEAMYDKYIAPYDIPGMANVLIEPAFDAAVRQLIRPLITSAFKRLQ